MKNEPAMTEEDFENSRDAWLQDYHVNLSLIRDRVDRIEDLLQVCTNEIMQSSCDEDRQRAGMVLNNYLIPDMKLLKKELKEYGNKS